MKTPSPGKVLLTVLACTTLTIGLEVAAAGPQPLARKSRATAPLGPPAPNLTVIENVVIDTPATPLIELRQNPSAGRPETRWIMQADEFGFGIFDVNFQAFPLHLELGAPNGSLSVSSNGYVGLGTVFPQQALHVVRGSLPAIRLEQDTTLGRPAQTWDVLASEGDFFVYNVTADTIPFAITTAGQVVLHDLFVNGTFLNAGFGTKLSIFRSNDNQAVQFRLQTNSANRRFVALNTAGAQQSQLVFGDNGAFSLIGPTVGDLRMEILSNGNVGIGTKTPDQKLSVNGNASKPGGGSWLAFSDERLKNIKGEYRAGLNALLQLKPIRYEYKKDNAAGLVSEGEHIGFGAAAVQKIIPEAVTKTSDGYLMVDNDPILWTMLNAIKDQHQQIQEQRAALNQQNEEIDALKGQNEKIAALEAQLKRLQAEVVLSTKVRNPKREKVAAGNVR